MNQVVILTGVSHPVSFNRAQGAYRLASVIRDHGFSTRVIDGVGSLPAENIRSMIEMSVDSNTKLFGISTSFFSNFNSLMHRDSLVTKEYLPYSYQEWMYLLEPVFKYPNIKIVVGGHKTDQFEKDKELHSYIDHYIYGYADHSIINLLTKNLVKSELIPNLDVWNLKTQYDKRDSFLNGETFTIEMQRGCMFKCSFCAYPMNGKQKGSSRRDPKLIVQELMYCYENFGSQNFILNSDTFNDDLEYLQNFNEELKKTNIKFNFGINARIDLFYKNQEMIDVVNDIGVRSVLFGLESSNPFSLKSIGKGLAFEKVQDTLIECKDTWKKNIKITGSYIVGLPYDTDYNISKVTTFFLSNDSPLDGIEFDPLYVTNPVNNKNPWLSEYTSNPLKYGFIFKDGDNWVNLNTPYKNFENSVVKVKDIVSSFPISKKGTIKSAAYMHLPNNLPSLDSAGEKFETVFNCITYEQYKQLLQPYGIDTEELAKRQTALRYFELFKKNNR